jgi:plasmid stability protein
MADLNIRNIDPVLIAKLKSDAALKGSSLRDHCVSLLTGQGGPEEPKMPTSQQLKKLKEVIEANLVTPRPDRPRHDPGTCRIYKCGMCAAMKEK